MKKRAYLAATLAASSIVTAAVLGRGAMSRSRPTPSRPSIAVEKSPIEDLDRCVQERMHEHIGFGMARFVHSPGHSTKFNPESPSEVDVVAALRGSGRTVGMYLGSRNLLAGMPIGPVEDRGITRPMAVTNEEMPADWPATRDLCEFVRRALQNSADGPGLATGSLGKWSVEARVVRADRTSCLECHSRDGVVYRMRGQGSPEPPLKIGDAVGVVIYVYKAD